MTDRQSVIASVTREAGMRGIGCQIWALVTIGSLLAFQHANAQSPERMIGNFLNIMKQAAEEEARRRKHNRGVREYSPARVQSMAGNHDTRSNLLPKIDGLSLGDRISESDLRRRFGMKCSSSNSYPGKRWCSGKKRQRNRRGKFRVSFSAVLDQDDNILYFNKEYNPAFFSPGEMEKDISILTRRIKSEPNRFVAVGRNGDFAAKVALFGRLKVEELSQREYGLMQRRKSPRRGVLLDYRNQMYQSVKMGLPVYAMLSGNAYVWVATKNRQGRGSLRFFLIDANALNDQETIVSTLNEAKRINKNKPTRPKSVGMSDNPCLKLVTNPTESQRIPNAKKLYETGKSYYDAKYPNPIWTQFGITCFELSAKQHYVPAAALLIRHFNDYDREKRDQWVESICGARPPLMQHFGNDDLYLIGKSCLERKNTRLNKLDAIFWLRRPANKGFSPAQRELAVILIEAKTKDIQTALDYIIKAAESGDPEAAYRIAVIYYEGKHISSDWDEALKWAKLAEQNQHRKAAVLVNTLKQEKLFIDSKERQLTLALASQKGNRASMYELSLFLDAGGKASYPKKVRERLVDKELSLQWLKQSASEGFAKAQYRLAQFYIDEAKLHVKWIRAAAIQGHPAAQKRLGEIFENGIGVETDYRSALSWYEKSDAQGYSGAAAARASLIAKIKQGEKEARSRRPALNLEFVVKIGGYRSVPDCVPKYFHDDLLKANESPRCLFIQSKVDEVEILSIEVNRDNCSLYKHKNKYIWNQYAQVKSINKLLKFGDYFSAVVKKPNGMECSAIEVKLFTDQGYVNYTLTK